MGLFMCVSGSKTGTNYDDVKQLNPVFYSEPIRCVSTSGRFTLCIKNKNKMKRKNNENKKRRFKLHKFDFISNCFLECVTWKSWHKPFPVKKKRKLPTGLTSCLNNHRGLFQKAGSVKTLSLVTLKWGELWVVHFREEGTLNSEPVTMATRFVKLTWVGTGFVRDTQSFRDWYAV